MTHRGHQAEGDTGEDHLQHSHDAHGHSQGPRVQGHHGDASSGQIRLSSTVLYGGSTFYLLKPIVDVYFLFSHQVFFHC